MRTCIDAVNPLFCPSITITLDDQWTCGIQTFDGFQWNECYSIILAGNNMFDYSGNSEPEFHLKELKCCQTLKG